MHLSSLFSKLLIISTICVGQAVWAAPKLRLSQTTVGPIPVAVNGSSTATVEASNAGDGNLNLQLNSSVPWLTLSTGAQRQCAAFLTCTPVNIDIKPGSLTAGMYTGVVTVSDPNALDAPQTITVTIAIGGTVPQRADFYLPATGGTQTITLGSTSPLQAAITTQNNVPWLAVNAEGAGSFRFGQTIPFRLTANSSGLPEGTYTGQIAFSGSTIAAENRSVPATLRITSQPIADYSPERVQFRLAPNAPKQVQYISVANRGAGTLTVSGATAAVAAGGSWLTVDRVSNTNLVSLTANPAGLATGTYDATVTIASNAAQGNITVPVQLQVIEAGAPVLSYDGIINNTIGDTEFLGQGTIAAMFGEQLLTTEPVTATSLPLPTELGGVRVFVNDVPAPLYYVSYNQINFQVPFGASTGDSVVRIERGGTPSNRVSTKVVNASPRLLRLGVGDYGIAQNTDTSLVIPSTLGIPGHAAKVGDTIVIYAIGLGQTAPAVESGVAAPSSPLARVNSNPRVVFGFMGPFSTNPIEVVPDFVGLSPGFVGLYQINVRIPDGVTRGSNLPIALATTDGVSNRVTIAVE